MNKKSKSGSSVRKGKKPVKEVYSEDSLIQKYKRLIKKRPKSIKILKKLADELFENKLTEQAIDIFNILIEEEPKCSEHYINLGRLYIMKAQEAEIRFKPYTKFLREAIRILKKAKSLEHKNLKIKVNPHLGIAYAFLGDFKKSISFLKVMDKINKIKDEHEKQQLHIFIHSASLLGSSRAKRHMGINNRRMKKFYEAIECFKKAIDDNENDYISFYFLGSTYYIIDQTQRAINAFNRCLELYPAIPYPYFEIGLIYFSECDYNNASKFFRIYLNESKSNDFEPMISKYSETLYFFCIGMLNWGEGHLEQATRHFKKSNSLVVRYNFDFDEPLNIIPRLIKVDKKLEQLHLSSDFKKLRNKLYKIIEIVANVADELTLKKIFSGGIISRLVIIKSLVSVNLINSFDPILKKTMKDGFSETKLAKKVITEIEEATLGFDQAKCFLEYVNFNTAMQAIEGVEAVISEIKTHSDPMQISQKEQRKIIKKLGPHLVILGIQTSHIFCNHAIRGRIEIKNVIYEDQYRESDLKRDTGQTEENIEKIIIQQGKLKKTIYDGFKETKDEIQQLPQKFDKLKIKIPPREKRTLRIGFVKKPYVEIGSNKFEIKEERLFAYLCRIAVANKKNQTINREDDLWLPEGSQDLTTLRNKLSDKINSVFDVKIEEVIDEKLLILFFKRITIHKSVINFESGWRESIETAVSKIFRKWIDQRAKTRREIEFKRIRKELKYKDTKFRMLRTMVRSTHLVKKSSEIKFGKFHDDNWIENWFIFLEKIDTVISDLCGEEIERELKDLKQTYVRLFHVEEKFMKSLHS